MTRSRMLLHHQPAQSRRLQRARKPRAIATASQPEPRRRANSRATARAFGHRRCSCPAAASPLRWPAIKPLARLRLAGGYRNGCSTTPEAAPLAFSPPLSPSCQRRLLYPSRLGSVLPAACAVSFAHGFVGYIKHSLLAVLDCTRPVRGKSQAIEHNSALPKAGRSPFRCAPSPAYRCAPCGFG